MSLGGVILTILAHDALIILAAVAWLYWRAATWHLR